MSYTYVVIGAGRQGVAAAYDLAVLGEARHLLFVDASEENARQAAAATNRLTGRNIASAQQGDARDGTRMASLVRGADAILSAAHYGVNLGLTRIAAEFGVHLCDLGGNTDIVRSQHAFDAVARSRGATIVPDCGMGPGLNVSLAAYTMAQLDEPREVRIWDGGLPQHPNPPWDFQSTFAMSGLTNEYDGAAHFLRNGQVTAVPCFADLEELEFAPPVGRLEAFVTSGGLSTAPWTWQGRLDRLENKTLRYPGHCARFKAYQELGLLGLERVRAGDVDVVPRDLFHALLEPRIGSAGTLVRDVCVMRVTASGMRRQRAASVTIELVDRYDEVTGFTAMQRLTGWHAAIIAGLAVRRRLPAGVVAVERVPGELIVSEGRRRGWAITERTTP
ncbi:MAG: saccharopine dehydrogenase C-terminal domain-containing protein [Acidobacteriota bacterium]